MTEQIGYRVDVDWSDAARSSEAFAAEQLRIAAEIEARMRNIGEGGIQLFKASDFGRHLAEFDNALRAKLGEATGLIGEKAFRDAEARISKMYASLRDAGIQHYKAYDTDAGRRTAAAKIDTGVTDQRARLQREGSLYGVNPFPLTATSGRGGGVGDSEEQDYIDKRKEALKNSWLNMTRVLANEKNILEDIAEEAAVRQRLTAVEKEGFEVKLRQNKEEYEAYIAAVAHGSALKQTRAAEEKIATTTLLLSGEKFEQLAAEKAVTGILQSRLNAETALNGQVTKALIQERIANATRNERILRDPDLAAALGREKIAKQIQDDRINQHVVGTAAGPVYGPALPPPVVPGPVYGPPIPAAHQAALNQLASDQQRRATQQILQNLGHGPVYGPQLPSSHWAPGGPGGPPLNYWQSGRQYGPMGPPGGGGGGFGGAAPGPPGPLGPFQRAYQRFHPQMADPPTLGRFMGSKAITTLGYGLTGSLLYGGMNQITEMIQNAGELERILNQVETQFNAVGDGADFEGFKNEILEIAAVTGVASKDVAFLAFQLKGAFGETAAALENTATAAQTVQVTGLSLVEVTDSMTAAALEFGVSFEDISDKSLGVQERFGVQAKETLKFFGDIAPVANEAGLSLDELGAIAGVAQQRSGRSGAAIAEGLGRIIPQIQASAIDLAAVLEGAGFDGGNIARMAGAGETGDILLEIGRVYSQLGGAQKQSIIELLGGRREAQILIPLLENFELVNEEIQKFEKFNIDAGKTTQYFTKLQETLSQKLKQAAEELRQLGEALFRAGLADLLKDMVSLGSLLIEVFGGAFGAVAEINDALGGSLATLLEMVIAVKVFGLTMRGVRALTGFASLAQALPLLTGNTMRAGASPLALGVHQMGPVVPGHAGTPLGFRGRGSAALANLGLGRGNIAFAGAAAVAASYAATRSGVQEQEQTFRQQVEAAETSKLKDLLAGELSVSKNLSLREKIGFGLFGIESPEEIVKKDLSARGFKDSGRELKFQAAINQGLLTDPKTVLALPERRDKYGQSLTDKYIPGETMTKEDLGRLQAAIAKKEISAISFAGDLVTAIEGDPDAATKLRAEVSSLEGAAKRDALSASFAPDGPIAQGLDASKELYAAGELSAGEYLKKLNEGLVLFEEGHKGGVPIETYLILEAKTRKEAAKLYADRKLATDDAVRDIESLFGTDDPQTDSDRYLALLRDPQFTNAAGRKAATKGLLESQEAIQDQRIAMAVDARAAYEIIMQGVEVAPEARTELLRGLITDSDLAWQTFLSGAKVGLTDTGDFITSVLDQAVKTGRGVREVALGVLDQQIAALDKLFQQSALDDPFGEATLALAGMLADLRGQRDAFAASDAGDYKTPSKTEATDEEKKKAREAADADQRRINTLRSQLKLLQGGIDPVADARLAISDANDAIGLARGKEEEELKAQIQLEKANQGMADAQFDITRSRIEHTIALAKISGDEVGAAKAMADLAQKELDKYASENPNDAAGIGRKQDEALLAQEAVYDADVASQVEAAEFRHSVGELTTQGLISVYQSMLNSADMLHLNEDEQREFIKKIYDLKQSLSLDQLLPFDFNLPTLYEARRITQTPGGFGGYQDNRQVSVVLYISNGMDLEAAKKFLGESMGLNARVFGVSERAY